MNLGPRQLVWCASGASGTESGLDLADVLGSQDMGGNNLEPSLAARAWLTVRATGPNLVPILF